MDPNTRALIMGAAGAGSAEKIYVEDVFSTWLYTGSNSNQSIVNGIDLAGKGGLVWQKGRDISDPNHLVDTARGSNKTLYSDATNAEVTATNRVVSFDSTGFTAGSYFGPSYKVVSWTFRKAAKFFDVVTYTGNSVPNRAVPHSLGSTPGCIIVKETSASGQNWHVWHRSLNPAWTGGTTAGDTTGSNNTGAIYLNTTDAFNSSPGVFTYVNSTAFGVYRANLELNSSGSTYVAYLFAHDAGGFGDSGNDSVVSCGSFTSDSPGNATVTLGWEPQFLLFKRTDASGSWALHDTMRGGQIGFSSSGIEANTSNAEGGGTANYAWNPTSTGFQFRSSLAGSGATYIYIAIRRGPMKTPTDATKVFKATSTATASSPGATATTDFPVDLSIYTIPTLTIDKLFFDRLRGSSSTSSSSLASNSTSAESSSASNGIGMQSNTTVTENWTGTSGYTNILWNFRRAPGFFDAVCYTGSGSLSGVNHNLAVAPELKIIKLRAQQGDWIVAGTVFTNNEYILLNSTGAKTTGVSSPYWNGGSDSATLFSVRNGNPYSDASGSSYVAYLFASCPGVSKVGSYTGTGTTLSVDCGFTNGARFVLIKRTDSTGDWYVWDTARGIIANNDPYLLLNSTAAEVTNTDYIDPLSSGFQISSTAPAAINANGGTFIYLAIA